MARVTRALLGCLGASLGAPKAPLSPNLVHLSLQVDDNLPLLAPTCALTSQLSIKFGPKLFSKLKFSWISDPPNLDFCNTLQHFSRFSIFQQIASKMLSKLQNTFKHLPNPSKMLPTASQEAPKTPPGPSQEALRVSQEAPRSCQEPPRSPKYLTQSIPEIQKEPEEAPRGPQGAPRTPQEPPSGLPRP